MSGSKHMVDLGISSSKQMPSCTCKDELDTIYHANIFCDLYPLVSMAMEPQTCKVRVFADTQALQDYFQSITDTEIQLSDESSAIAINLPSLKYNKTYMT